MSLNPLKLAGQCGKLKCCLNYELDSYLDAIKDIPDSNTKLETQKGRAFHQKTDIFKRMMWFSYFDDPSNFIPLTVDRVNEIIALNKEGEKPDDISIKKETPKVKLPDFENVVGQDSLTRFDNTKKKKKKKKKKVSNGNNMNTSVQNEVKDKPKEVRQNNDTNAETQAQSSAPKPLNNPQKKQHRNNNNRNRNNNNRPPKPSSE